MNETQISMEELTQILEREKTEYDIARIVNPYACSTMRFKDGTMTAEGTCHHIWKHDHRCSNCFSRRACIQHKVLYKTEVMEGKSYRIKSTPYRVKTETGEVRNYVIESVRICELSRETVNSNIRTDLKHEATDYVFNEAMTGVIRMAARTGAPIVPVYIPRDKKAFRRVDVVFGEPYTVGRAGHADYEPLARDLMDRIMALKDTI